MTAMFQGEGGIQSVVGPKTRARLPGPIDKPMSDMQVMQQNERKQHEQTYIYEHGHNDGSAPLGKGSF